MFFSSWLPWTFHAAVIPDPSHFIQNSICSYTSFPFTYLKDDIICHIIRSNLSNVCLSCLHFQPRLSLYICTSFLLWLFKAGERAFLFLKAYLVGLNLNASPSGHCVVRNLYRILDINLFPWLFTLLNKYTLVYLLLNLTKKQRGKWRPYHLFKTLSFFCSSIL